MRLASPFNVLWAPEQGKSSDRLPSYESRQAYHYVELRSLDTRFHPLSSAAIRLQKKSTKIREETDEQLIWGRNGPKVADLLECYMVILMMY